MLRDREIIKNVCVLFSLKDEAIPFQRKIASQAKRPTVNWTGMGMKSAARCTKATFADLVPELLLVCGFAGGLKKEARPGTLVIADRIFAAQTPETVYHPNKELLSIANSVHLSGVEIQHGTLITYDRVITTANDKKEIADETNALAIDMETAGILQVATEWEVPWLVVRAITDGVSDTLPLDFNTYTDEDGEIDRDQIIKATLSRPWKIPALIRIGQRSSLASKNLATFLDTFLQKLTHE